MSTIIGRGAINCARIDPQCSNKFLLTVIARVC